MTLHEEVLNFAREYVNNPKSRTAQKKQQIKAVYQEVFGTLFNVKCGTCYIAALIKLVKQATPEKIKSKPKIMATSNYKLKPGAILTPFGHRELYVFDNEHLTDELAEANLKLNPSCIGKFAKVPANFSLPPATDHVPTLKIVPVPEIVKPEVTDTIPEVIKASEEAPVTPVVKKKYVRKPKG
jgi:hypothetical protein